MPKKSFRIIPELLIVFICVIGIFLYSCDKKQEVEQKTIRIWQTESDPAAIKVLEEIIEAYCQNNPSIKIEHEAIAWAALSNKLTIALSTGDIPDIVHLQPFMVASMYKKNLLAPMDDLVKEIGESDIYESLRKLQFFNGHYYGIAHAAGTSHVSYRKDWADEKGLSIPKTWDEYSAFIKALTEDTDGDGKTDRYGVILPGGSPLFIDVLTSEWVASNGGRLFDPNGKPTFTEKQVIEVLERWKDMVKYAPPDWTSEGYSDQFRSLAMGRGASVPLTFARASKQIDKDADPKINNPEHFALMQQPIGPSGTRSYATIDCEPWTIFASSKVIKEAKDFLKFFYQKENYVRFCQAVPIHLTPALKSVAESPEYSNNSFAKKWEPWQKVSLEMISQNRTRPLMLAEEDDNYLQFLMELQGSRIITDMVLAVTSGEKTSEEAAKEAQKKAEDLITQLGYKAW